MDNVVIPSYCSHDDMKKHPMDQPSTTKILNGILPKAIKDELSPSKKTMGHQGMGCRCPTQMLYVWSRLASTIREEGGIKMLDTLWAIVQSEEQENEKSMDKADNKMLQAWKAFIKKG